MIRLVQTTREFLKAQPFMLLTLLLIVDMLALFVANVFMIESIREKEPRAPKIWMGRNHYSLGSSPINHLDPIPSSSHLHPLWAICSVFDHLPPTRQTQPQGHEGDNGSCCR